MPLAAWEKLEYRGFRRLRTIKDMVIATSASPQTQAFARTFVPTDLKPTAFPHAVTALQVRETNISWVILTGPFAYKIKRPVRLDFIDTSTLARRHELCNEELRLNRRLAAELYVDVVAITENGDGPRIGGSGEVLDYAVRMRQFDSSQELLSLLERGEVTAHDVTDLAGRIAEFHEASPRAPFDPSFPHTAHLHDAVLGTLATLLSHLDCVPATSEISLLIDWTHDYLHDGLAQLRSREQGGAIRECHGDLHARNVVKWNGRLLPFDCLEFDPKLRWIDVMNDVAFLVMDLGAHGRKDLAFSFLNAYLERTGGYAGVRHLSFYAVYRALVRAMVDALAAGCDTDHARENRERLRQRLEAAVSYAQQGPATLYLMHGTSGSGKSWLSERLAPKLGAVRIRSDVERKRLAGAGARGRASEPPLYGPEMNRRTYARLRECAQDCLEGGVDTMVDAAFLRDVDRAPFVELATRGRLRLIILDCEADPAILTQRIEQRAQQGTDPSDADTEVLVRQRSAREPLKPEERALAIRVETALPLADEAALAAILDRQARKR